jgi:hypothetical protein
VYKPEPGFPDLLKKKGKLDDGSPYFPEVASYAGQVVNRELQPGEKIFRIFGPEGYTHGVPVGKSWASGPVGGNSFWGLNDVPGNARDWRLKSAVLDEWNHDHFIVVGTVLPGHTVPACTGIIAEQSGKKLGMQYLEGGAKQAILNLPADVAKDLGPAAELVQKTGKEVVIESGGIRWELRPTGWSEANGSYGYGRNVVSEIDSQTERLAPSQVVSKKGE